MEPILLHVWSPKNGGVGAERPSPPHGSVIWTRGRVYEWTRGRINRPFFLFFFLDKSRKLSKILSVLQSASVERFDVSRMRDFFFYTYLHIDYCFAYCLLLIAEC